jgi:Spy/CpxP family protein refolding chaperone
MKKRIVMYGLVFIIIINISALIMLAYSRLLREEPPIFASGPQMSPACLQSELNLTPDQIQKMQKLRVSFSNDITGLSQEIQEKNAVLFQELKKAKPDMARIDSFIDEISRLQVQIQKKTILNLLKDKSVLNPDQRDCYFSIFETHVCGRSSKHSGKDSQPESSGCSKPDGKTENFEPCVNSLAKLHNILWR